MDWTQFLAVFGATVLGSGGISGIVIHLWKKQIEQKYVKELEIFKSKLQQELEGYKAGYQRLLDENNIRFSWWHQERAQYLKNLYVKLSELHRLLVDAVSPYHFNITDDKKKEMGDLFITQYIDCETFYRTQKIFLSTKQIQYLDDFFTTLIDSLKEHCMSKNDLRAQFKHSDFAFTIAKSLEECLEKIRFDFCSALQGKDMDNI